MKALDGRPARAAVSALAYVAIARLSLALAIPPGYSTVVWPAAGVAFALTWLWGAAALPGVLLGSCAANMWMTWDRGFASPATAALSLWIAAGSTAQAAAAVALVRRAARGRDPLADERDLAVFLALGGPVACLLAASWASVGMSLFGVIRAAEIPFSWTTWWVGDSIGSALAAPLLLLWTRAEAPARRRARTAVTAALAATGLTITMVQTYAISAEERLARSQAAQKLADVSLTLRVGIGGHIDALQSASDLFASRERVTRAEFERFARGLLDRHPGIQAVEWRPRVPDARRAEVEAAARSEGLSGFQFMGLEEDGRLARRARAPEYFPILFAEPLRGNERALGLDINRQQPEVHEAAERALATRKPAASGGVRLVQETGAQTGVAVLVPVLSAADGRAIGLLEGVYRVGDLMESLLAGTHTDALSVRVIDVTEPNAPHALYSRGVPDESALEAVSMSGDFAGRRWRIELVPNAGFQARERSPLSWFALGSILALSYLIAWVVLSLYSRADGRPA
ncbi:MAG: CHASE domain-containing protein [Elusimicrobia bacterium]|nr:CHASE domain-containing protein [Elusimicrobiota bacterium]